MSGITPWILYDFRGVRWMNRLSGRIHCKGLIDKRPHDEEAGVLRDERVLQDERMNHEAACWTHRRRTERCLCIRDREDKSEYSFLSG